MRRRLTALYGALFLAAGMTVLGVNYILVRRNLPPEIHFEQAPGRPDSTMIVRPRPEVTQLQKAAERFRQKTLDELLVQSALALGVTALASVGLGWVMAGRALRPVHEITAAARRLSEENLHERLNMGGPNDELRQLADTFDAMLERLDRAFESQGRFVANASHELRTPLAVMRTELEVAARDPSVTRDELLAMGERLRSVIDRSEGVVDRLLALTRSLHGPVEQHEVDLADVAETALAELDGALAGLDVQADLQPAVARGDGGLLDHLAANLVANAAHHNVPDGWVRVRTWTGDAGACLEVENAGAVIDPADVDGLFEPFRRHGRPRTATMGAGLGLSIVKAVADAHHGDVRLEARAGGGLKATVALPR